MGKPTKPSRKTKTKAQRQLARAKYRKRLKMSRDNDLKDVNDRIAEINTQMAALNAEAAKEAQKSQQGIEQMLKDAGIFEAVHKLEKVRSDFMQNAQKTMQDLQAEQQKLNGIKEFLEQREKVDPSPIQKPKPVLASIPPKDTEPPVEAPAEPPVEAPEVSAVEEPGAVEGAVEGDSK